MPGESFLRESSPTFRNSQGPLRIDPYLALLPVALLLALGEAVHFTDNNLPLFLTLNAWGAQLPDAFWANATQLGDTLVTLALLIPLARRYPAIIWAVFVGALFATVYVHGIKPWFDIPRPPAVLAPGTFHQIGPAYRADAFPSGHSATVFTVLGVCILYLRSPWLRALLFAIASLVAVSRIMVGVHWPLDVIFGALGGWVAACLGGFFASRWPWGLSPWSRRVQLMVLLVVALALIGHDGGYPQAAWLSWIIGVPGVLLAAYFLFDSFRSSGPAQGTEPPSSEQASEQPRD
jgi:membrane-associated phospholipid phosphatase